MGYSMPVLGRFSVIRYVLSVGLHDGVLEAAGFSRRLLLADCFTGAGYCWLKLLVFLLPDPVISYFVIVVVRVTTESPLG